jgi:hypothetical protein
MKRAALILLMLLLGIVTCSCNKPAASESSNTSQSIAFSSQVFRTETMLGPELREAIRKALPKASIRGIGVVCKHDNLYFVAVHFYQEKEDLESNTAVIYLDAIVLIDNDGKPYWKLHLFTYDQNSFFEKHSHLYGGRQTADKEDDE